MPTPKVSIVVSTYGRLDHFKRLAESVWRVFPHDTEIIAVSSDPINSAKAKWLLEHQNVTVIWADTREPGQHRPRSLYAYENMGIKAATGEWVFVTNDDTEFDTDFYSAFCKIADNWDVIMVNGHLGDVGLGCRTAVIGHITPPDGPQRPLYLYDFTIIRKLVYEKIGYLDEGLDWFGKGFDLAMACETQPGLKICYESEMKINHSIAAENRRPPHYARDFQYATEKWQIRCAATGWNFVWPW